MGRRGWLLVMLVSSTARADVDGSQAARTVQVEDAQIMPFALSPRHEQRGVVWSTYGGDDNGASLTSSLEATLVDRVAARVGVTNDGAGLPLRAFAGMTVDVLRGPVDVATGVDWQQRGFNTVPALAFHVAAASMIARTRFVVTAAYDAGLDEGERGGELGIAALRPVTARLFVGGDARARVDLERDNDEPPGERDFDVQGGALATWLVGPVALSAVAGANAYTLRLMPGHHISPLAMLGLGAVF